MDFIAVRGRGFQENFDFKNSQGKPIAVPPGTFKVVLERGTYAREYTTANHGLAKLRNQIIWNIPAGETKDFAYNTLYYTLYLDDQEVTRGLLKVQ